MPEISFATEVGHFRLGGSEECMGEVILANTKGLLTGSTIITSTRLTAFPASTTDIDAATSRIVDEDIAPLMTSVLQPMRHNLENLDKG